MTSLIYGLLFASVISSPSNSCSTLEERKLERISNEVDKLLVERAQKHENQLVEKINIPSLCNEIQHMMEQGIKRKHFSEINHLWDYMRSMDQEARLHHPKIECPGIPRESFDVITIQKLANSKGFIGTNIDLEVLSFKQ